MIKKYLLLGFVLCFPFVLFAQSDPPLLPKLFEGIRDLRSVQLNEHVNVLQANIDNENFNVAAVNDKMQVLWNTPMVGFADTIVKFNDKIIALAATDHSAFKGGNNTYKAYVIDPSNGKILVEKIIFTDADDYMQFPSLITGDGSYLKLFIRKTGIERRLHVGFLGTISINKIIRQYNETRDITLTTLNDKLETVSSFKPVKSNGTFIDISGNKHGDLFVSWLNGPSVEVYKYDAGKTNPTAQITADIAFKEDNTVVPSSVIKIIPAKTNDNEVYYAVMYEDDSNNKPTLGIGKFNFSTNKKAFFTETFNKDHTKALVKSFVPVNKKIDDVDFGPRSLNICDFTEQNGLLLTTVNAHYLRTGTYASVFVESNTLINAYDTDLNLKFQQLFPSEHMGGPNYPRIGLKVADNKLYVIANAKTGMTQMSALYGVLDIKVGKWEKMNYLSKRKISNGDIVSARSMMWFGNCFILPYLDSKGLMQNKLDVTLQQNEY